MEFTRRNALIGGLSLSAGTSLCSAARADGLVPFEGLQDFWLATDAYIYRYPLVTMEMTRQVITNVATAEGSELIGAGYFDD